MKDIPVAHAVNLMNDLTLGSPSPCQIINFKVGLGISETMGGGYLPCFQGTLLFLNLF